VCYLLAVVYSTNTSWHYGGTFTENNESTNDNQLMFYIFRTIVRDFSVKTISVPCN